MGRASRKTILKHIDSRPPTDANSLTMNTGRRPSPSPAVGGAHVSSFVVYNEKDITTSPKLLPQGPPLLEDNEENPDAALLEDIAVGQIGKDTRGNSFQLLRAKGGRIHMQVDKVLLRSLDNGEIFWVDCVDERTLLADTVSYGVLKPDQLQEWLVREERSGDHEDALWLMKDRGLWDWQVRYSARIVTKIGNWLLHETPENGRPRRWFIQEEDLQRAEEIFEEWALDLETFPAIEQYKEDLLQGMPDPDNNTDKLRRSVRSALVGARQMGFALDDLAEAALTQKSKKIQQELYDIAGEIADARPLPKTDDTTNFLIQVAPLWRRISAIRLED